MAYEHLCMYCFEDLQGQAVCPHCGRDSRAAVPQIQMLPGTLVYHQRFLVGRALGQDAGGIVYSAFDTKRENKLRLREYLPRDCAERLNDGSVVPMAGLEDQFERGMKKLRASVEGVDDPKKRHFFFEENGTAYIAQRKSSAAAASGRSRHDEDEDEDEGSGAKQIGLIVGIAAAVVVVAAVVIVSLVNGALNSADDLVQNPTLAPSASSNLWAPEITASPTPYVSPTFAALVDPEQSWMDYTYTGDVNHDFQQQVNQSSTRKPTPKPTLNPSGLDFSTVNGNSSREEIEKLQNRLADLGWLSRDSISGKYDSATKQAVKDFQNYVNSSFQPAEKLSVDGIAGPKTLQWLYATEAVKPTPTPTPVVTPDPNRDDVIDKDSAKGDIKMVQQKLIVLGLMEQGTDDGVYGTTTTAAVKKFQQRVNQLQGYDVLPVSGTVDPDTLAYLNYYVEWWLQQQQATATPEPVLPTFTPAPTAAPTDAPDQDEGGVSVTPDSPKESIAFMQEMLIGVGLLNEGSNDGVYGNGTKNAVSLFQQWVNSEMGETVLAVTGIADADTLSYLEYAFGEGMQYQPAATEAPTAEPVVQPVQLSLNVGGAQLRDGLYAVTSPTVSFTWTADGAVSAYYVYVYDQNGGLFYEKEATDRNAGEFGADSLTPGMVYTIQIGALPEGGDQDSMSWVEASFYVPSAEPTEAPTAEPTAEPDGSVTPDSPRESIAQMQSMLISVGLLNEGGNDGAYGNGTKNAVALFQQWVNNTLGENVLEVTGIADAATMQYLQHAVENGMTYQPAATEAPTSAPTSEPTEAPTAEPTAEPDGSVTPDSPRESVAQMQGMLIAVGLLNAGSDDGAYGNGTKNAVALFQQWVNSVQGEGTLAVTGIADAATMQYLQFAVDNGMTYPAPEATAAPTSEPTSAPTDAPDQDESGVSVTPDSPRESIAFLQEMLIGVGLLNEGSNDGAYGNGTKNAVSLFQQWVNSVQGEGTLAVTGIADADTLSYLEYAYGNGMRYPAPEATDVPQPDPTDIPQPDPTEAPTAEPTEAPTAEPTLAPMGATVQIPGALYDNLGNATIPFTLFDITWTADVEADMYAVVVYRAEDLEMITPLYKIQTTDTFASIDLTEFGPGAYNLLIGARIAGTKDVVWSTQLLTIEG